MSAPGVEPPPHTLAGVGVDVASPRVVVAGEALVDLIPLPGGTLRPHPGGGPFNAARAMSRLGLPAAFLGRLSTDAFGRLLADRLAADGVDLSLVSGAAEPTTLAVAEVDASGSATYRFYTEGTSAPGLTPAQLPRTLRRSVDALHLGTLGLALEPMATTLAGLAVREAGRRLLMLDLNVRPGLIRDPRAYRARLEALVALGAVVQGSDADLAWLHPRDTAEAAAARLLAGGARLVVVTLGARGAMAVDGRGEVRVPAPPVEVVDTIGAGDAFGAALLRWLLGSPAGGRRPWRAGQLGCGEAELRSALTFAVAVASLTCARDGADPPRLAELSLLPPA